MKALKAPRLVRVTRGLTLALAAAAVLAGPLE